MPPSRFALASLGVVEIAPQITPKYTDSSGHIPSRWGFCEWFVVAQVFGPALLFLPGTQPFRILLRTGVFGISLVGLFLFSRELTSRQRHPAKKILAFAIAYISLMIFHPATNTYLAGFAQIGLHLAVMAPLVWAPRYFQGDFRRLSRVLTILWVFNGASAVVGILQVRDPGTWMPRDFSSVAMSSRYGTSMYMYQGADGQSIIRPPGLGDTPGAACGSGLFVAAMGLAYLGLPVTTTRKLLALGMSMVGVTVIFLSMVRTSLVILVGSAFIYLILLFAQKRTRTALTLLGTIVACGIVSLGYATTLGGASVGTRFSTLLDGDPLTVYQRSARLDMVTNTFDTILVNYPLGAGLGRYGMMRGYFGDETNTSSPGIWAEVQFTTWVLDGGFVFLSLYLLALLVTVRRLLWLCLRHHSSRLRQWVGVIVMLSAGPIAMIFSYCPFNGQTGIQFWFLVGAIEGVLHNEKK